MNKKYLSFKTLIIVLLVAFAIIPIMIFTVQLNQMVKTNILGEIWEQKQSISDMAAKQVESYIFNARNTVEAAAAQKDVGNFQDLESQKEFIDIFQDKNKQFLQHVYIMDVNGKIVNVSPMEGWDEDDFGNREWFQQVKSTNSPYISDSLISDATNEPMVFTVYPINDEEGNFKGAIGADIDLEQACNIIENIKSGETGRAFAVDKKGVIVAHPQNEYVLEQRIFENELVSKVLAGEKGIGEYIENDTEVITAYAPTESLGWGVFFSQDKKESLALINDFKAKIAVTIAVCAAIAIILGFLISKSISHILDKLVEQMQDMAKGDLRGKNIPVKLIREFALAIGAFSHMNQNLCGFIKEVDTSSRSVSKTANQLAIASNEVSDSIQDLAKMTTDVAEGSQQQAKYSSKTLESLTEMMEQITAIDESIASINTEVNHTYEKATQGKKSAKDSSDQMDIINQHVSESSKILATLEAKSNQIGSILSLITDIADQTNLLSLNAAIEAARAGEQGRGFAVVADEIRKLSEETNNSTLQVTELISEIQKEIKKYIEIMDITTDKVQTGVSIIHTAEESFTDIADAVVVLPERIKEIATQINQIVTTTEDRRNDMKQVTEISQELAAGAEEMAASTQQQSATVQQITSSIIMLSKMAKELDDGVKKFKV